MHKTIAHQSPSPMPPVMAGQAAQVAASAPRLTTEELFAGGREIALLHNGRQYRLRITQQGKLLLTA
ncbi:MAG TPA: hemin uptake protein HemP [Burkholderiales bacterium]